MDVLEVLKNCTDSNYVISRCTGITEASIGNYKRGKTTPTKANKNLLLQYFSGGESRTPSLHSTSSNGIPLIPIEAMAGFTAEAYDGVQLKHCEHYNVPEFTHMGCDFLIRVSGSSMYPKYSNGDVLACKKIHEITFFQFGKIYVIDSNQGALVKRIFKDDTDTEKLLLVSENKEKYPPFSIDKSEIHSLSIVLGVIRFE